MSNNGSVETPGILDPDQQTLINKLSREICEAVLEGYGFAVLDNEPIEDLRQAVETNVLDGSIPYDELMWYVYEVE